MKNNIRITLEYDGSRYDGWQKQGNTYIDTKYHLLGSWISTIIKTTRCATIHRRVAHFTVALLPPESLHVVHRSGAKSFRQAVGRSR